MSSMNAHPALQVRISEVPSSVNPTPRPSTTSGGRPGTAASRKSAEFNTFERPEVMDYEDELNQTYGSVIGAAQIEEAAGGGQSIEDIVCLTLRLDTSVKSISSLGFLAPNLRELTLDHSRIASMRDLGVDLRNLLAISMNDCSIDELDGIGALINIQALTLRNNNISDVSPIAMHDMLETLDLHGNRISDISVGDILSSCPKLTNLTLSKNAIDRAPHYTPVICALIPQLSVLDGCPIDAATRGKVTNAMILDASAAMNQIREEIEDEERLEMCIIDSNNNNNGGSNINGGGKMNSFGSRNSLDSLTGKPFGAEPDTGSELTHGSDIVLAGGVAAAMRRRRANRSEAGDSATRNSYDSTTSDVGVLDTLSANASQQHHSSRPQDADYNNSNFLHEGDLTVAVLGHQPRPGTSGGRPGSSASPRPSTSQKKDRASTHSTQLPTLPPTSPATAAGKSAPKRSTSKGKLLLDMADVNADTPLPSANELFGRQSAASGGRPPRSPLLSASSPRAASPYQHNETRPSTTMSNGRPMSTYSSYSDDGNAANLSELAVSAPSAPFKVSVPIAMRGDDLVALRHRLAPQSGSCSDDEVEDHDTVLSGNSHSTRSSSRHKDPPLRVSTARQTTSQADLMDLNEYENGCCADRQKPQKEKLHSNGIANKADDNISSGIASSNDNRSSGSNQVKGIALLKGKPQHPSSIVHRDVVKRRSNRFCGGDESDTDDDDEDILVDHTSRHNLMMHRSRGSATSLSSSPSAASRGARLGADLMAQMSGTGIGRNDSNTGSGVGGSSASRPVMDSFELDDPDDDLPLHTNHISSNSASFEIHSRPIVQDQYKNSKSKDKEESVLSKPPMAPSGGPTLSSIAGRSLGFDLSGSLAAINQWVEDMDTGGSSDEDSDAVITISNRSSRNNSSSSSRNKIPDSVGNNPPAHGEDSGHSKGYVGLGTGTAIDGSNLIAAVGSSGGGSEEKGGNRQYLGTSNIISREDKERSDTSSHGSTSRSYNSSNREILSRQKILSMCVGKDDRDADDLSLDNDILFFDVNSGEGSGNGNKSSSGSGYGNTSKHPTPLPGGVSESNSSSSSSGKLSTSKYTKQPAVVSVGVQRNIDTVCDAKIYNRNSMSKNIVKVHSAVDYEGVSEDDDEGDLNDLYAENMRLLADPSGLSGNNSTGSPRESRSKPNKGATDTAVNKPKISSSVSRNSNSNLANIECNSNSDIQPKLLSNSGPKITRNSKHMERSQSSDEKKSISDAKEIGDGVKLSDSELVEMLNRPPKTTYALRTKSNFQDFFRGMDHNRMMILLEEAYAGEENLVKRRDKVERRMELLRDVLI